MTYQALRGYLQKLEDLLLNSGNMDGVIDNGEEVAVALVRLLQWLC